MSKPDIVNLERTAEAMRLILKHGLRWISDVDVEIQALEAKRDKLTKDYEEAEANLLKASNAIKEAKLQLHRQKETGAGPPLRREPKTKTEKALERRARLLRKIGRIDAELQS